VNNEAVQTRQAAVPIVAGGGGVAVSAKYVTRLSRPLKQGSAHGMINPIPRSPITGITSFMFPSSLRVHCSSPIREASRINPNSKKKHVSTVYTKLHDLVFYLQQMPYLPSYMTYTRSGSNPYRSSAYPGNQSSM
jgi:hypothetical protein